MQRDYYGNDGRVRLCELAMRCADTRRTIDENRPAIVIVERRARRAVRGPVRVLDRRRVVVIVVVVRRQVDVRRRQQRRNHGRRDQQPCGIRPADAGRDHAGIILRTAT